MNTKASLSNELRGQPQLSLQAVKKAMHVDGRQETLAVPSEKCHRSTISNNQQQNGRVNSTEDQSTSSQVFSTVMGATLQEHIHTEHSIDQKFMSQWQKKVNESSFDTSLKKYIDSSCATKGVNKKQNFQQLYSFDWRTPGCFESLKCNGATKAPVSNKNSKQNDQSSILSREQKKEFQQNMIEAYLVMDCGKREASGEDQDIDINNQAALGKKNSARI